MSAADARLIDASSRIAISHTIGKVLKFCTPAGPDISLLCHCHSVLVCRAEACKHCVSCPAKCQLAEDS